MDQQYLKAAFSRWNRTLVSRLNTVRNGTVRMNQIMVSDLRAKRYKVRLCAILPWFAVLFATLSGLLLHSAAKNTNDYRSTEASESQKIARTSDE
jgi:hypothetical protein